MSNKILLLEDDPLLSETLIDLLEDENYTVLHAPNGEVALDLSYENKFSLYLFDINVPLIDGITCLKELRDSGDATPCIFLTSHKEKKMLQNGFESGGDDYIKKPFDNDELLLRIQALLKRNQINDIKCIDKLCHDAIHQRILYEEKEIDLSKKEYLLLLLLMQNYNATVPKELIFETLWNSNESVSNGAIRVYITRIKNLLPSLKIENIRGIGYKFVS